MTPRRRRISLVAIVASWTLGMLTHSTNAGSGDEPHYLAIAHSLAFDGDLDMANNYGRAEPLIAGGGLEPGLHVQAGTGGIARPVHDVGLPLLFVPYVRAAVPLVSAIEPRLPSNLLRRARLTPTIFYRNVIALGVVAIAAVLALLTMELTEWAGASPTVAFWTTAVMAVSVPISVFSFLLFTEIPSAAAAVGAAYILAARQPSRGAWALAGVLSGLLLLLHSRNLGIVLGLGIVAALRLRHTRAWSAGAAHAFTLVTLFVVRVAIIHHLWGTWLTTRLAHLGPWVSVGYQARGVGLRAAGLLLDQEYGLLVYAPFFILAVPGIVRLGRVRSDAWFPIVLIVGCYLGFVLLPLTNPWGWSGGWCPPARFLVPVVPFMLVAVAAAVPFVPRLVIVALLVVQMAIDAYSWQHPKNLWNDGDGTAAICTRGGLPVCAWLPSLTRYPS